MAFPTKVIPFSQACKDWLDSTYSPIGHAHSWTEILNKPTIGTGDVTVVAARLMGPGNVSYIRLKSPRLTKDVCIYSYIAKSDITQVTLPIPVAQVMGIAFSGSSSYNRKGRVYMDGTTLVKVSGDISKFVANESFIIIATVS